MLEQVAVARHIPERPEMAMINKLAVRLVACGYGNPCAKIIGTIFVMGPQDVLLTAGLINDFGSLY